MVSVLQSELEELQTHGQISVVVPAYNEEKRISPLLGDLTSHLKNLDKIIVVVDGNDNTEAIAKSFGGKINVLRFRKKLGRGGAVLRGITQAESEIVCFIDADGAAPWFELAKVAAEVSKENPCVVASRWVRGAVIKNHESVLKTLSGRIWHYILYLILGLKVKDVQCGLKCFYGPVAKSLVNKIRVTNSLFDADLLFTFQRFGIRIVEKGISWTHMKGTKMSVIKNHVLLMFLGVLGIRLVHTKIYKKYERVLSGPATKILNFINEFH
jgi:glycosyltransferase involved in cell wall biosynthesis